jgi:hypothetical protein
MPHAGRVNPYPWDVWHGRPAPRGRSSAWSLPNSFSNLACGRHVRSCCTDSSLRLRVAARCVSALAHVPPATAICRPIFAPRTEGDAVPCSPQDSWTVLARCPNARLYDHPVDHGSCRLVGGTIFEARYPPAQGFLYAAAAGLGCSVGHAAVGSYDIAGSVHSAASRLAVGWNLQWSRRNELECRQ